MDPAMRRSLFKANLLGRDISKKQLDDSVSDLPTSPANERALVWRKLRELGTIELCWLNSRPPVAASGISSNHGVGFVCTQLPIDRV